MLLAGCESCFDEPAGADPVLIESLDGGWPEVIIDSPDRFRDIAQGDEGAGWSKFFYGDYEGAAEELTVGRAT